MYYSLIKAVISNLIYIVVKFELWAMIWVKFTTAKYAARFNLCYFLSIGAGFFVILLMKIIVAKFDWWYRCTSCSVGTFYMRFSLTRSGTALFERVTMQIQH